MGLKKYSEYISENKNMKTSTPEVERIPKVEEPKTSDSKKISIKKSKQNQRKSVKIQQKEEVVSESIVFNGKVVSFFGPVKPSSTISLLESKNISKEKLHFIITEQQDSIVILKYNLETEMKLKSFTETFIKYHQNKLNIFEGVTVEGSDTFSMIKNLKNNKKLLIENLIKLLK